MKLIPLSKTGKKHKGKYFAMVDDEDFGRIVGHSWNVHIIKDIFYATRRDKNNKIIYLHREIMGLKKGDEKMIDHKDRNGLNCQKDNMRECSYKENNDNRRVWGKSKLRGIYFDKEKNKWKAQLSINGKQKHLGYFLSEIEASEYFLMFKHK